MKGEKRMHFPWFKRRGFLYIPNSIPGVIIFLAGIAYAVREFMRIDSRSHSVSDTMINFLFELVIVAAIYSLVALMTSRGGQQKRSDAS